jgi:hypothetical protein
MGRYDPPYKNFICSLSNFVFFNYIALNDYFQTSFQFADETSKRIELKIKEWDTNNPDHQYSGFEINENDLVDLINFESKTLIAGILIIHSEIENNLKDICNSVGQEKNKSISYNDIKCKGNINKCKKYLEQEFHLDFSVTKADWDKLKAYNRLRNIITHQNRQITFDPNIKFEQQSDVKRLSVIKEIDIGKDGFIQINDKAVIFEFLKLSEKLLDVCCDLLYKAEYPDEITSSTDLNTQ